MTNPAFDASQRLHSMAGEAADKRVGYLLTGLSVVLVAAMVIKECKAAFRDDFREWERHHERHRAEHGQGR